MAGFPRMGPFEARGAFGRGSSASSRISTDTERRFVRHVRQTWWRSEECSIGYLTANAGFISMEMMTILSFELAICLKSTANPTEEQGISICRCLGFPFDFAQGDIAIAHERVSAGSSRKS